MKSIFYLLFLVIFSCTTGEERRKVSEGMVADYGQVVEFFLPLVPKWANFSVPGKCFRSHDIQYLNYQAINKNHSLEYSKLVQLQAVFNAELVELEKEKSIGSVDRAALFYETIEKISGGLKYLDMPTFKKYYLLWGDLFEPAEFEKWLKKYINSPFMTDGVPVVVSTCQHGKKIDSFFEEKDLDTDYPYIIGAEAFSVYNEKLYQLPSFYLNLSDFFPKDAEVIWVVPEAYLPFVPQGVKAAQKIEVKSFN